MTTVPFILNLYNYKIMCENKIGNYQSSVFFNEVEHLQDYQF
jgi:hypothetical protein